MWTNIYEAVKSPLRQILLFVYAYALSWLFGFATNKLGFTFSDDQKLQLMGLGTTIVWGILSFIDNLMHQIGKAKEDEGTKKNPVESKLTTGISRF